MDGYEGVYHVFEGNQDNIRFGCFNFIITIFNYYSNKIINIKWNEFLNFIINFNIL